MNETLKSNYYALLIAITKGKTAKESLLAMGICPDNDMEEEKKMRELWKQRLLGLISICTGIASLFIVKEATVALFLIWLGLLFILQKEVWIW